MNWKVIRLELGRTPEFPAGSAGRAYLIRVPVEEDGTIDEAALATNPTQATVRRFWPSQPDRAGQVVRSDEGWELRCNGSASLLRLGSQRLELGGEVMILEPDGCTLPFRIAGIRKLA